VFLSFSYNGKEIKRELNESEHNTLHNTNQQWTRGERRTKWAKGKNHASFHSIVFFLLSHFLLSFFHLYLLRLVDSVPFLFLSLQAREGSAWMKEEQEANGRMKWTKRVRYEESTHSPHSTCLSSFHSLTSFLHSITFDFTWIWFFVFLYWIKRPKDKEVSEWGTNDRTLFSFVFIQ